MHGCRIVLTHDARVKARGRSPVRAILPLVVLQLLASCAHTPSQSVGSTNQSSLIARAQGSSAEAAPPDDRDVGLKIDYLMQRDRRVRQLADEADAQRAAGRFRDAQASYELVLRLDAGNARARSALAALPADLRNERLVVEGEQYLEQGKTDLALERAAQVLEGHARNDRALALKNSALDLQSQRERTLARERASRALLDAPVTLQFRDATIRTMFEALTKSTGLNVLFDRDVRQEARSTAFLKDVSLGDAVDLILMQHQLEKRVVNGNTLLIYPQNPAKQAEYQDLIIRSFQITNADIKYLSNMLKSMLRLKEVAADERSGVLVIRDTPESLRLAEKLIAVHDLADPEIMLEVEVLEVSSARSSNLGIKPPASLTITTPGTQGSLTLGALRALRRDDLLATTLSTTLNFKLEDADAKILASPRIRARNREKAKIMIGDRVPTIVNSVTPVNTGGSVVTGSISYQDVGLKLEFEPQVYAQSEVGIKITLEVSNIAQQFTDAQGGRSYQIGTRNASTNLRLRDGETQILGGLITDEDRNTASKIPGLGHLPVIGRLFGNNDGSDRRSEVILAITPRIVRDLPQRPAEIRTVFSGTANALRDKPILAEPVGELKVLGTFGGGTSAAPSQATPPAAAPRGPAAGGVIFNAVPSAPTTQPASPGGRPQGGGPLAPPPPMLVRPPAIPASSVR